MSLRQLFFSFIFLGLLFGLFNNCGKMQAKLDGVGKTSLASMSTSLAICEGQLRAVYQRTYFPFLVSNCNNCHSTAHGSRDLQVSFNSFRARGESVIDYQSTHAHGGNNLTSELQKEIDVFKPSWTQAQTDYLDCMSRSSLPPTGNADSARNLKLNDKVIPNIMGTLNGNRWASVEWDVEFESGDSYKGYFKTILKVEAKLNQMEGSVSGVLFRNPKMRLKGGSVNIEVSGLMIHLGGQRQSSVTTYSGVSKVLGSTSEVDLVDGGGSAYVPWPQAGEATLVSFEFDEIRHTAQLPPVADGPPPVEPVPVPIPDVPIPDGGVTHTQLNNSNSPYRVFNRSCVGCHNSGSGRLDLRDYDAAKAAASLIIQRINSTANPMPPTGLLRQNDRDLVQSWVNAGAPK